MKKFWLHGLALSLGLLSSNAVFAQYPNAYNNFGPSSYPVASQPGTNAAYQSLPQVPQSYNGRVTTPTANQTNGMPPASPFQFVGNQEGNFGQPSQNVVPQPQPGNPQVAAQANVAPQPAQPGQPNGGNGAYAAPMDYGYAQSVAPHAAGCGPAPVTNVWTDCSNGQCAPADGPLAGLRNHGHNLAALPPCAKPWFFGGGVLFMNRIDNQNIPLSFNDSAYAPDVLGTQDARMGVMPGFEVMMGRYFNCGRNAVAATYWGIYSEDEEAVRSRIVGGDYRSRMPFSFINTPGTPAAPATPYAVYDWYDNAYTHLLRRSSNYHNVEVNLLGFAVGGSARNFNMPTNGTLFSGVGGQSDCGTCDDASCGGCGSGKLATGPCCLSAPACGSRLNLTWLAGVRYFRFEDNLTYAASLNDSLVNRGADDLYYDVNTTNDLFGFQFGSRADYCVCKRVNAYGTAKAGVYNNRSTLYSRVGTDFQTAYLNDTRTPLNPSNNVNYLFNESKDEVAFLGELGTGVGVRMSPKWTATVGYRIVGASGVATSTDNVLPAFANYSSVQDYDNRGSLILHGLNVGALYNY